MKLWIEIPEKTYQKIIEGVYDYGDMNVIIQHGIPPESRPHGEWIYKGGKYWCSSCGEKAIYHSHVKEPLPHLTNYCPNCGASMEKEDDKK